MRLQDAIVEDIATDASDSKKNLLLNELVPGELVRAVVNIGSPSS